MGRVSCTRCVANAFSVRHIELKTFSGANLTCKNRPPGQEKNVRLEAANLNVKILIADDDASLRELLAATLRADKGYEILIARDGAETIEIARKEHPRLIVLDLLMPKLDGIEVCQTLKTDPKTSHIKIMLLTAAGYSWNRDDAEAAGADQFVTKPYSPIWLLQQIENMVTEGA